MSLECGEDLNRVITIQRLRPECYPLQNPEIQRNFELVDTFPFRSQGRGKRAGPPPAARPQPARVAGELALAIEVQAEIDRDGLTYREVARRHACSRQRICRLLALARLAPDIQNQVARMTTVTASETLDRQSLEWVAEALDWDEQRARVRRLISRQPPDTASSRSNAARSSLVKRRSATSIIAW